MTVTWFGSIGVTAEISLATPGGPYASWDDPVYGWDLGQWGPDITWVDVSQYLRGWSTTRGFREDGAWTSGKATITLANEDGRFSADNPSSPYTVGGATSLIPWRPVRLSITYGTTTTTVMTMLTGVWEEPCPGPSDASMSTVTVPCQDEWSALALAGAPGASSAGSGELFGPRLHRILDAAGHRGPRDIESGTVTMQATTLSTAPTAELQLTADTEGGRVHIDADGTFVGRGRQSIVTATRSTTVQLVLTDTPASGEGTYSAYSSAPAGTDLRTAATYTRVGGTQQTYVDMAAAALSRVIVDERADLIADNDTDVLTLATWKVILGSTSQSKINDVVIDMRADPTLVPAYLGLREHDLVKFVRHAIGGYTIERYAHVTGIAHAMSKDSTWHMTLTLTDATVAYSYATSLWNIGAWDECKWMPA